LHEFTAKSKASIEGALEDLETLQTKLAYQVLSAASVPGLPTEAVFLESNPKRKITAIENFVRGLLTDDKAQQQKFLEQALKIEPRYGQAAFRLGELLVEQEAFGQAVNYLDRVQRPDPNYWEASFLAGIARFEMGEYRAAIQYFDRVAREVPLSEVINNLGVSQFRAGLVESGDTLRRSLEGDEKDADYHFNLGLALMGRAAWAQAADEFRAVLDRDSNDAEATKMLGRCLRPPMSATQALLDELHGLARLKLEFNEFAYRQLKSFFQKPGKP
jgi:tetratricopeptide (TPR) repeat protein